MSAPGAAATEPGGADEFRVTPPTMSLPRGGGAISGIGEKFSANPATGTGTLSVPLCLSGGRGGFGPALELNYDSGAGNGPFGLGWDIRLPRVTRKTSDGLPRYRDEEESDVFVLSGAEDLVPLLGSDGLRLPADECVVAGRRYQVTRYRPRVETAFARIERWVATPPATESFWHTISRDNVTTLFGGEVHGPLEALHDLARHRAVAQLGTLGAETLEQASERCRAAVESISPSSSNRSSVSWRRPTRAPFIRLRGGYSIGFTATPTGGRFSGAQRMRSETRIYGMCRAL